jgi:hypothetical protein
VVVVPLKRVSNASSVSVEPISTDDWELLEMNAEDIEAGALLNQISIVYPGQKLNITVNNISFNIQILKLGFISQNARDEEDECLRLVASTEIIVTPKPRGWDNQARSKTVRVVLYCKTQTLQYHFFCLSRLHYLSLCIHLQFKNFSPVTLFLWRPRSNSLCIFRS